MKQFNKMSGALTVYAGAALLMAAFSGAVAADEGSRAGVVIEEMTVTARKVEESLQNAPISISAYSGDGLEARGMTNIAQIAPFVPTPSSSRHSVA